MLIIITFYFSLIPPTSLLPCSIKCRKVFEKYYSIMGFSINHQKGKNKATLFQQKVEITLENVEILKSAIKRAAINESVIIRKVNEYCT